MSIRRFATVTAVLSVLATMLMTALGVTSAFATHIRGASLTWTPGTTSGDVVFSLTVSARADYPNNPGSGIYPAIGSQINTSSNNWNMVLNYGDGTSTGTSGPVLTVQSIDKVNDVLIATGQVTHRYASLTQPYLATFVGTNRLSTSLNNHDTPQVVQTIVTAGAAAGSPSSSIPPIVDCPVSSACNFYVPATDPARRTFTYRLSTSTEMGGTSSQPETQPPGATIDSTTGLYRFTTTSQLGLWSTQVMIESHSGGASSSVVASTAVDFLIRVSSTTTNAPPAFDGATPADRSTINGSVGTAITAASLSATDPNSADRVTLTVTGSLPPGITLTTGSPANPATGTISGTPTVSGQYPVNIIATDQNGAQTFRSITFDIAKLLPTIDWSAPAGIVYGTALAAAQLNASMHESGATGTITYFLADGTTSANGVKLHAGTAQTLIAKYTPDAAAANTYAPTSKSVTIDVSQASQTISVTDPGSHSYGDAPFGLSASGGGSGNPVTFASTTPDVCTTGGTNGHVVTIVAAGACTVTADQAGNADYVAATQVTVPITVGMATPDAHWSDAGPVSLTYGQKLSDVVTFLTPSGISGTTSYALDDATPITADAVLDAGNGQHVTATFTPTGDDANDYVPVSVPVTVNIAKRAQTVTLSAPATATYGDAPLAVTIGGDSTTAVTLSTTTPDVCVPASDGSAQVAVAKSGECDLIAATSGDANNKPAQSAVAKIVVAKAKPSVDWTPEGGTTSTYGDPLEAGEQLNMEASAPTPYTLIPIGSVAYTMPDGTDATDATPHAGSYKITATWTPAAGTEDYWAPVSLALTFTVNKAVPVIDFNDVTVTYGTVLHAGDQLNAALAASNVDSTLSGTFSYSLSAGGTTVNAEGAQPDAGDYAVTVRFTPSASFAQNYDVADLTKSLHVDKAQQVIVFGEIGSHTFGDAPFTVNAPGGASGNPVVLTPTAGSTCTTSQVDGTRSTVTITGAGGCLLTATQTGNDNYFEAAPVQQAFTSDKATPTLDWAAPSPITYGTGLPASDLVAVPSVPGVVAYTEGTQSVAAGDKLEAGNHLLTATLTPTDSANYYGATAQVTLHVDKADQVITFAKPDDRTFGDAAFALTASGGGSGNGVTFGVVGPCTVDGNTLTITGAGDCTVTAQQAGDPNYNAARPVVRTFTIAKAPQVIHVTNPGTHTFGDEPFAMVATGGASGQPLTFVSNTPAVCEVASTGTVTIDHAGDCQITAEQAGTSNYAAADDVPVTFTVNKATQHLALAAIDGHIYGDHFDVDVTPGGPGDTSPVVAVGSGPCSVKGVTVTTTGVGSCVINVTQAGDDDWLGAHTSRTFQVDKATPVVSWTDPAGITYGDTLTLTQLSAGVSPTGLTGAITYQDENGADVAVGDLLNAGRHTLTATFTPSGDDAANWNSATARADVTVDRAAQTIVFNAIGDHTYGEPAFGVSASGGASGNPVTFSAANQCSVVGDLPHNAATVTLTGAGACTLTAAQDGTSNYTAAHPVQRTFGVGKGTPQLAWADPDNITFGAALGAGQLNAQVTTAGVNGTFAYTLPGGGAAAGAKLNAGTTLLTATFTPDAASGVNWQQATKSVSITVDKAPQQLAFAALPDATYGDGPITLSATRGASGEPVTFTATGSCSVAGATLTITHAGSCKVTADEDGDANWLPSPSVDRTFSIGKATQAIAFTQPAGKTYGDVPFLLSASGGGSGNAVTFSATGAACTVTSGGTVTVIAAGTCNIAADQMGNGDYKAAPTVSRTLSVDKASQSIAFVLSGTRNFGDAAFGVTASADSGLLVSFTASGACSVSGSTVTLTGVGTCAVTAHQSGNSNWKAAPDVTQTVDVTYVSALAFDNTKATKSPATIPVKVTLTNAGRNISAASIPLTDVTLDGRPAPYPGTSQVGELFTYMGTSPGGFYQFNVKTDGVSAGTHTLAFRVAGDPVSHSLLIYVR